VAEIDAPCRVAGDDVAGHGGGPTHRVAGRSAVDPHATTAVGQCLGAGGVGADVVALDHVVRHVAEDRYSVSVVAGDDVGGCSAGPSHRVAGCPVEDDAAVAAVGYGLGTRVVGADVVALIHVVLRTGAEKIDAPCRVARDDVARPGSGPAH